MTRRAGAPARAGATRRRPIPRRHGRHRSRSQAREASRRAFEAELLSHRAGLYASALRFTRNPDDAQDLVQDTLVRALAARDRFEPGSNCRAWLQRILANAFISGYRRRRRHLEIVHDSGDDAVLALFGGDCERARRPEDALLSGELADEVVAALAALAPEYRRVVELADLEGLRYRDIAARLGLPLGTVMSRLHRARRQLEIQLADYAAADYGIRRAA